MSTKGTKRVKLAASAELGLQGCFERQRKILHTFDSLAEFLNSDLLRKHPSSIYGLFSAIYKANADELNSNIPPSELADFSIKRNEAGRIVSITDPKAKTKLSSPKLRIAMATQGCVAMGSKIAIFSQTEDKLEVLAIPSGIHVEKEQDSESDARKPKFHFYDAKRHIPCFASPEYLKQALSHNYVALQFVSTIVMDANQLAKGKEPIDLGGLVDLDSLVSAIHDQAERRLPIKLLNTLMSSALVGANLESKVSAFEKCPSPSLARLLGLSTIYQRPLSTSTKATARRVKLADLDAESLVTMNKTPISESEYLDIPADIEDEMVIEFSDNLGVVKNKRWVKASSIIPMPKKLVARAYAAIAKSSAKSKASTASTGTRDDGGEEEFQEV